MNDGCEKRLAEQVLGDSSLTDDLEDQLAQPLLDWGVSVTKVLCQQAEYMEADLSAAYLDRAIGRLRKAMRRVNNLIGQFIEMDEATAQAQLERVIEAAQDVVGVQVNMLGGDSALLTRTLQMQGKSGAMSLLVVQVLQIDEVARPTTDDMPAPAEPKAAQTPPASRPGRARPSARVVPPAAQSEEETSEDNEEGNDNAAPRRRLPF